MKDNLPTSPFKALLSSSHDVNRIFREPATPRPPPPPPPLLLVPQSGRAGSSFLLRTDQTNNTTSHLSEMPFCPHASSLALVRNASSCCCRTQRRRTTERMIEKNDPSCSKNRGRIQPQTPPQNVLNIIESVIWICEVNDDEE
jgi:hypothetical protein